MPRFPVIQQQTIPIRIALAVGVLLVAVSLLNPLPFLNTYGGRVVSSDPKDKYLRHGGLNNKHCWLNTDGRSCEDVKIHQSSGTAFLACGDPVGRSHFYPAINNHRSSKREDFREYFIKYDIKRNSTTKLRIEGWDGDLILHGLDIWTFEDDPAKIHIFAVNHGRGGDSITIFSHQLGTDILTFVKDVKHKHIKTPNAVTPDGPQSFFITNDHYYTHGFRRTLEDKWAPFSWASHVVYCDASGSKTTCQQVSDTLQYANGILLTDNGQKLLVNDLYEGTTIVYDVQPETHGLVLNRKIRLGALPDNLSEIPTNGDIVVPVFPNQQTLMKRGFGPGVLDYHILAEAAVLRLVKDKGYSPELLYWDDGSLLSIMTGAAVDPYNRVFIGGGVFAKSFVVCDISDDMTGVKFG